MRRLIAVSIYLLTLSSVEAQEVCTGILSYASRDNVSESRSNSVASSIYTEHCEGATAKSSSATSVGLEAVVKAIPIKFSYGGNSNSEKLNNFCKVYDGRRAEFSAEEIDSSIVVRQSLDAFNDCISLAAKDIYFNPKIGRTSLVVDIRRGSSDASINGVLYDPKLLNCRIPPLSSPDKTGSVSADKDSVVPLNGDYMPLTCDRIPQNSDNGSAFYPGAELIIATTRGSFSLPIAADTLFPERWATEIDTRLNSVEALIKVSAAKSMKCEMAQAVVTDHYPRATAIIPSEKRERYKLTGGGCTMNSYPELQHNGTVIESRPSDDGAGWFCFAGDPPNIPLTIRLTAYAIFCGQD